MTYVLEAVLGRESTLREAAAEWPGAVVVPLRDGLAMVPLTKDVLDLAGELPTWSARSPVAHVEAEFFGGSGTQRAVLWAGGQITLGPLTVDEDEPFPPEGSPISQVLAALGVRKGDHFDEFDAAGLGRHRWTDDWARDPGGGSVGA